MQASWAWSYLGERDRHFTAGDPASARRIDYWRRRGKLGRDDILAFRLAAEGFASDRLATLIGPDGAATASFGSSRARDMLDRWGRLAANDIGVTLPPGSAAFLPMLPAIAPLLAPVRRALDAAGAPAGIAGPYLRECADRLHQLASRTLALQLAIDRIDGVLDGATPGERFAAFVDRPGLLRQVGAQWPALARLLTEEVARACDEAAELTARVLGDRAMIEADGLLRADDGPLVDLSFGHSDRHAGGRTVVGLVYASGRRLMYKPKPLAIDAAFHALCARIDAWGLTPPLPVPKVVDRGEYGYMEFVAAAHCPDETAVGRFFRRQGAFLALLYACRGVDVHSENIIAAGEHPYLIDLECLLHPPAVTLATLSPAQGGVRRYCEQSVLSLAMLPTYSVGPQGLIEVGGLGGRDGQMYPHPSPTWIDVGQDTMRLVLAPKPREINANIPEVTGPEKIKRRAESTDFLDDIRQGFADAYRVLLDHRDDLLAEDGVVASFERCDIRYLVRPTWHYAALLWDGIHPDYLLSGADRELAFERLWGAVDALPGIAPLILAERDALRNEDVPVFRVSAGDTTLRSASGETFPGFFAEAPIAAFRRRIDSLSETDLARQVGLIEGSLAAMRASIAPEANHLTTQGEAAPPIAGCARDDGLLLAAAEEIAHRLCAEAIVADDETAWLGCSMIDEAHWRFGGLGSDLYAGSGGIAVFLAWAGRTLGHAPSTARARSVLAMLEAEAVSTGPGPIGAFTGDASRGYALLLLAEALDSASARRAGIDRLAALGERCAADDKLDLLGGVAGVGLLCLNVLDRQDDARLWDVARICGDRLLAKVRCDPDSGLLGGLSHGASGLAWAAAALGRRLGDAGLRDLAARLLAFEAGLRDGESPPGWRDRRYERDADSDRSVLAWCHGAPGIGLARLRMRAPGHDPLVADDLARAIAATRARGWQPNQSLCHGSLGNADLLLQGARATGDAALADEARRWGVAAVRQAQAEGGWRCGVPLQATVPGLLTGLGGIGLQLLRLASDDAVPAVLTLDVTRG